MSALEDEVETLRCERDEWREAFAELADAVSGAMCAAPRVSQSFVALAARCRELLADTPGGRCSTCGALTERSIVTCEGCATLDAAALVAEATGLRRRGRQAEAEAEEWRRRALRAEAALAGKIPIAGQTER